MAAVSAGCVERKLLVRTEPPGAAISINHEPVGVSPLEWRFDHYGEVLLRADHPGYEPLQRVVALRTPWYERPVADFFADVVWPGTIEDRQEALLVLEPIRPMTDAEAEQRKRRLATEAARLREEALGK